jgi:hypothetical protein
MIAAGVQEEMTGLFMLLLSGERHHRVAASVTLKAEAAIDGRRELLYFGGSCCILAGVVVFWRELLFLLSR